MRGEKSDTTRSGSGFRLLRRYRGSPPLATVATDECRPCKERLLSHRRFCRPDREDVPAPNAYHLPSADAYKYGRAARVTIRPRRPAIAGDDDTPPPNSYRLPPVARGPATTFGRKPDCKRIVYVTVDDLAY